MNIHQTSAIEFLRALVAVQSVSGQEQAAVSLMVDMMHQLGFEATIDEAGNALGVREKAGQIDTEIVLLGHIDTVPGSISVRIEDGNLYGRGAVDAKGPLATFLFAAAAATLRPGMRLIVIGAVEEESATSKGARFAAKQWLPDYCIIGEPSGWDAVTLGYKGRLLIDYFLSQPMGHTAGPRVSVGAQAVTFWNNLCSYAELENVDKERLFDQIQPSLRSIHTDTDGLSDSVRAKIGIRLPLDFDLDGFRQQVDTWAGTAELAIYGHEAAYQSDGRSRLATLFRQVMREKKIRPRFKVKTGTSDMNIVGPIWQCPIVAYGPGDSRLDHTPDEHINLEEYIQAIDLLSEILSRLHE